MTEGGRLAEIETAAARLFAEYGYHAASMRQLGRDVGIEAPSLYNHFAAKQDLLVHLLLKANRSLLAALVASLDPPSDGPVEDLRRAINTVVRYTHDHPDLATILRTETRALVGRNRRRVQQVHDNVLGHFRAIVDRGAAAKLFRVRNVDVDTSLVFSLCMTVGDWYNADGVLSPEEVGELCCEFVLVGLDAR